jgi:hypothetical protein
MAVDQPPSPRHENTEASSSWGTSSLRKCFHYKGSDVLEINPEYDQEGTGRGICPFHFNDGSDDSLTDDEMPNMRQIINKRPSS